MIATALLASWCALAPPASTHVPAAVHQHVVVIGNNSSVDPKTPPLAYADDDAARFAEVFAHAASLRVLSVLDSETQRLFPAVAQAARAPTLAEFHRALDETFADIARDRDAGVDADLVFIFIGHGAVGEDGEGYVSLLDAKLTRTLLFDDVIARSPARFNHIIIDSCSAYRVLYRGSAAVSAVRQMVEQRSLARYPNTGALLATSSARETHEWSRIRGGVFSHEVLGALAGAADVDGDGALRYAEVGAFIESANAGVVDPRARVDFSLRPPPLFLDRPLTALTTSGPRIAFATTDTGHFIVEDGRGVAVAELHKDGEQPVVVSLFGPAPFRVTRGSEEWRADAVTGRVALTSLARGGEQPTARSAVSDALLEGLFSVPFGRSYVAGYAARLAREPTADTSGPFPWASVSIGTVGGVLALGAAAAAVVGVVGLVQLDQGRGKLTAFEAQDTAARTNLAWGGAGALAVGAGIAGAAAWLLVPSTTEP